MNDTSTDIARKIAEIQQHLKVLDLERKQLTSKLKDDYVDLNVPTLARMHEKRLQRYRVIGYE